MKRTTGNVFLSFVCMGLLATSLSAGDDRDALKCTARLEIEKGTRAGRLVVNCNIPEGKHIYSLGQSSPPGPTKIKVASSDAFKLPGKFVANRQPTVIEHDPVFETRLELFSGKVAFTTPIQIADGADLEKLPIEVTISCQLCSDSGCVLIRDKKIEVEFGGYYEADADQAAINRTASGAAQGNASAKQ